MALPMLRFVRKLSTLPLKDAAPDFLKIPEPLCVEDYFGVRKLFTVQDLFEARVHLGHKEGTLNDYMRPYLFGSRLGHLIFDLDKTAQLLGDALNFLAHLAYRDGIILFVSRHRQTSFMVEQMAKQCKEYAHTRHWHWATVSMSNKIHVQHPDLVVFLHTQDTVFAHHLGVRDSSRMMVPTIGVVDTDCDPRLISYPIPGNDDSPSAVQLYCRLFKEAIQLGKAEQKKKSD